MKDHNIIQESRSLDIYNVTRLNQEVRSVLEGSFPAIWIQGEISNFVQPASGHFYFSLKDEFSQVRCAMFRNKNRSLDFTPKNGNSVLAHASVSLYEDRGDYQLIINHLEPAGDGLLQRAFEKLKNRLFSEGLFDDRHKENIPGIPGVIGVITSPSGAAVKDILSILGRRYPYADVIIYPVPVQGDEAAARIISMLDIVEHRNECDVVILARGGGSMEDLWAFNDERLARRIFDFRIPIVTGIGHEIDFTIADFVADQRAATPSAAAELVSPDQVQLTLRINEFYRNLIQLVNSRILGLNHTVQSLGKRLPHPASQLQLMYQRLDGLYMRMQYHLRDRINLNKHTLNRVIILVSRNNPLQILSNYQEQYRLLNQRLMHSMNSIFSRHRERLAHLTRAHQSISPYATLNRGYAIVTRADAGEIIRDTGQLDIGEKVDIKFAMGSALGTIEKLKKDK